MECNKEEAIRAREIAEGKMRGSDFDGARKFALKAQQLFPDLENISQLLTVCEVHCSAKNRLFGSEKDWYGILQLERLADEAAIKKQYRKLALLLHPDKNKFAGAEAAFKLIGEANMVLSDAGKRSLYDMKCRASVRTAAPKPPPHHAPRNSFVRKQYGVQNNPQNVASPQFTHSNSHKQTQSGSQNGKETFWTCCPFCNIRYQYYKEVTNRTLRCQNCEKPFCAYDMGPQGVTSGSNLNQPVSTQQKGVPTSAASQAGSHNAGRNPASTTGVQGKFTNKTVGAEPVTKGESSAAAVGGPKAQVKEDGHVDMGGRKGVGIPKPDAVRTGERGTAKNTSRKRGRKLIEESSESSAGSSSDDVEDVVIEENGCSYTGQSARFDGGDHPRRSSRHKQHISYNESSSEDDFVNPLSKRSKSGSSSLSEEEKKEAPANIGVSGNKADPDVMMDGVRKDVKQNARAPREESLPNGKKKSEDGKVNGAEAPTTDRNNEKEDVHDDSHSNPKTAPEVLESPDPDFSDFDRDKEEHCFHVDQMWAVYDNIDGMPRYYAQVRKVLSPGFNLQIRWLEPDPEDPAVIEWAKEGLPIACGKFKLVRYQNTEDRLMFSHRIDFEKVGRTYVIYPRKGETWALFTDWDIRWSCDPENHQPYKFEFVEILSDFCPDYGIGVAYLSKVKGFVSLFMRRCNGVLSCQIPPSELLRFSHRIPSFRMTGAEREGVPEGSFELDPASLPNDLDKCGDLIDVKVNNQGMDAEVNGSNTRSSENEVKLGRGSETTDTPRADDKIYLERETLKVRRSSRESNSTNKKSCQASASQSVSKEEAGDVFDGSNEECHGNFKKFKGSAFDHADEEVNTPKKQDKTDLEREALKLRRSPRDFSRQNQSGKNVNECTTQDEVGKQLDDGREKNHDTLTHSKGSASSCEADEKTQVHGKDRSSNSSAKSRATSPIPPGRGIPEGKLYDFNENKSEEKFEVGQIWALYSDQDRLPKNYAQIKRIDSSPEFSLQVAFLEACSTPSDGIQSVCCGRFKVKNGKLQVVKRKSFSHLVRADSFSKNQFDIHPRKGEVWAIYKSVNTQLLSSKTERFEYDIVVVLEDTDDYTKVSVLARVNGFASVYKARRRQQRLDTGVMDIPRGDISRFSHQIPAYWHTGEGDNRLRDCCELDPASLPGTIICLD